MRKTIIRIEQGNYYNELLKDYSDILQIPELSYKGSVNHYWVYGIVLKKQDIRDKLINDNESRDRNQAFLSPPSFTRCPPKNFQII